jgi:hypothetical protein
MNQEYIKSVNNKFSNISALTGIDMTRQAEQFIECEVEKLNVKKQLHELKEQMDVLVAEQRSLQNEGIKQMRSEGLLLDHLSRLNEHQLARLSNFCDIGPELAELSDKRTLEYKQKNNYRTYL